MTLSPAFKYKDWFPLTEKDTKSKAKTLTSPTTPSLAPDAPTSAPSSTPNNAAAMAKRLNLVHRGQGYYARSPGDRPTYKSSNKGQTLVPVAPDEAVPAEYDRPQQVKSPLAKTQPTNQAQVVRARTSPSVSSKDKELTQKDKGLAPQFSDIHTTMLAFVQGKKSPKGTLTRGLGTVDSWKGEMTTALAIQHFTQCGDTGDKCEAAFRELKLKGITPAWRESAISSAKKIIEQLETEYGAGSIDTVLLDEEAKARGGIKHRTSSDIMVFLKDGKGTVGVSLKKDDHAFLYNGGVASSLTKITSFFKGTPEEKVDFAKKIKQITSPIERAQSGFLTSVQQNMGFIAQNRQKLKELAKKSGSDKYHLDRFDSALKKINGCNTIKKVSRKGICDLELDEWKSIDRVVADLVPLLKPATPRGKMAQAQLKNVNDILWSADKKATVAYTRLVTSDPDIKQAHERFLLDTLHFSEIISYGGDGNLGDLNSVRTVWGNTPDGICLDRKTLIRLFSENEEDSAYLEDEGRTKEELDKWFANRVQISIRDSKVDIQFRYKNPNPPPDFKYNTLFILRLRRKDGAGAAPQMSIEPASKFWTESIRNKSFDKDQWHTKE